MHKRPRRFATVAGYVAMLLTSVWALMALSIDLRAIAAVLYAAVVLGVLWFLRRRFLWQLFGCLGCFLIVLTWWLSLKASNEGNWQADVSRTAWAEVHGNQVTIHDLRLCDYKAELDYTCQWLTRTVDLSQIDHVDLYMNYWGSPLIAHTILSFDVRGALPVAFSIETRKHGGQTYSALLGFFRQFTLISVVSDERDVVRVRTNYRHGEDLYLFRTVATPAFAQQLFMSYIQMTNRMHDQPMWYNAITHNCTTEIFTLQAMKGQPYDWRILLNGKADEMAYERGKLVTAGLPFETLKKLAWINPAARAANHAPAFSQDIRENRPGFPAVQ